MQLDSNLKAVCSVSELVKKFGLSRARFYQLQKMGVFPQPIYCTRTKRPFYFLELQQKCIEILKTGIGHNGQIVIFYTSRQSESKKPQSQLDYKYEEITYALKKMGISVTCNKVKNAIKALYPSGLVQCSDDGMVIRDLFRYLKQ